ncbi:hypothetical protein AVEN_194653-1 [Araneus ventricosus]|uniref:Uncharacterized protein n=1 Tax=Araneus ventricosus TaxID=182803 RepID=A0A4Y2A6T5_ARAVE|nr:hypothetical protein AVEN_194653-1 [Araneus ventricosus]
MVIRPVEVNRVYSGTPGWVGRRHFFRTLTTGKVTSPNPTGGSRIDPNDMVNIPVTLKRRDSMNCVVNASIDISLSSRSESLSGLPRYFVKLRMVSGDQWTLCTVWVREYKKTAVEE